MIDEKRVDKIVRDLLAYNNELGEFDSIKTSLYMLIMDFALETKAIERGRWITPIQLKVYNEIQATLSPRITDLIRNTGYGNSTVQKALKKLLDVDLIVKGEDNIYRSTENGAISG